MTAYITSPLQNGTRVRTDHNTLAGVVGSYAIGDSIRGDSIWVAPADGAEVKRGDQWLHVTHINGTPVVGWMAIIHKGAFICETPKVVEDGTPAPSVKPVFPETFVMTAPNGEKASYQFVELL